VGDIEEFPVEAGTGRRASGTVGDRLLVALALATLLAGLAIAVSNLIADDGPPVVQASARPTGTQRPTGTPHPPGEVTLVPGDPPSSQPQNLLLTPEATFWLSAADELPLRRAAFDDAPVFSSIASGEVRLGVRWSDPQFAGWLYVPLAPPAAGWIRFADIHGQLLPVVVDEIDKGVDMITAGDNAFVAQLHSSDQATTIASADGEAWDATRGLTLPSGGPWPVAWGPSGWLAATTSDGATDAWVWESSDGSGWTTLGALRLDGRLSVEALAGSSIGYLMTLTGLDARDPPPMWFSPDGLTWHESADPWPDQPRRFSRGRRIGVANGGFVVWQWNAGSGSDLLAAFSNDGRSWRPLPVEAGVVDWFEVAPLQGALVGLSAGSDGVVAAWAGSITGDNPMLRRDPKSDASFSGARVTALTSDGTRAYAFGYDERDGTDRAWVADSRGWQQLATPIGGFGAVVRAAAAGAGGLVVAGAQMSIDGASPVLWHLLSDGSWQSETRPIAARLYPPFDTACGELPATALAFAVRNAGFERECFGDQPMTFDAWSGDCRACWLRGEPQLGREPAWLAEPAQFLELMPYEGYPDQGWYRAGVLPPEMAWREEWAGTWVRVTGHFDDPAAHSCGAPPDPVRPRNGPDGYLGDQQSTGLLAAWQGSTPDVWRCMSRFVVTEVVVIPPP
jgi:hypothetical protein